MRHAIFSAGFIFFAGPVFAEPQGSAPYNPNDNETKLNELRAAAQPKRQIDIDTLQLASAHRERAASVEEKTNGLWQSWTTSICEGCGDTPSYRKTVTDDFSNRRSAYLEGTGSTATIEVPARPRLGDKEKYARRLYTDLSPETVGQIRRMPSQ